MVELVYKVGEREFTDAEEADAFERRAALVAWFENHGTLNSFDAMVDAIFADQAGFVAVLRKAGVKIITRTTERKAKPGVSTKARGLPKGGQQRAAAE